MPEQKALDLRQGQDTGHLAALFRKQIVRSVSEHAFDDVAPFDTMKERRVGTRRHEVCPSSAVVVRERPYLERPFRCNLKVVVVHAASRSKTRSIRSQRKSLSS